MAVSFLCAPQKLPRITRIYISNISTLHQDTKLRYRHYSYRHHISQIFETLEMPSAVQAVDMSISTVSNVNFINDPNIIRYDEVLISKDLYEKLFKEGSGAEESPAANGSSTDHFVLIKLLGSPDYFNTFNIYKVSSIDFEHHNLVTFVNNTNLSRFRVDELTLSSLIVQSIQKQDIPILSKIYVSVPSEIYSILSNTPQDIVRSRFLTKYLANGGVVNENDEIRLVNGKVRLCEPLGRGLVSNETEIVLIKENGAVQMGNAFGAPDETTEVTFDDAIDIVLVDEEDSPDNIDFSAYLTSSLNFSSRPRPKTSAKFKVKPLPDRISIDGFPQKWAKEDSELYVFISSTDFIKLGFPVFNGDLIKLNCGSNSVMVKIFTLTEPNKIFKKGVVYLSPILIINLNLKLSSMVTFDSVSSEGSQQFSSLIPVAELAIISRISSQITMDKTYQKNFLSSLKTGLSNQFKCVQKGDFFPVVIDTVLAKTMFDNVPEEDELEEDNEGSDNIDVIPTGDPDAVAWFKIIDIKGESSLSTNQFLIDPNKTLLVSSGVEFVRFPKNEFSQWYEYLNLPQSFNFNTALQSGNFKYAQELKKIIQTCLNSKLNLRTTVLLSSLSRGIGKTTLVRNIAVELGLNLIELDCFDLINPGQELKTIGLLVGKVDKLISNAPPKTSAFHVLYLKHIESLCPQIDSNDQNSSIYTSLSLRIIQTLHDYLRKYPNLCVVLSCNDFDKVNDNIKLLIKFNIEFNVPTEAERLEIFKFLINNESNNQIGDCNAHEEYNIEFSGVADVTSSSYVLRKDINFNTLALQSAGLTPRDLISIIKKSKKLAIKRLTKLSKELGIPLDKLIKIGNGGLITWIPEDFSAAINEARNQFSDSIGAPRIPNVKWEDIGGLDLVKDEILDTIDMPLKHPELFNNGLKKRSGILFYGPPGTGKTLLAKAIATNFSLNFFSVKGPELLNMYIGESEANVRRVFQRARDAKPCVIFFDELDSVAPKRGNQGDSGGVMDRIVSQLLAELDGMSGSDGGDGLFVVGATNRPDLLDEALLRPGRFDKLLYLGISDTNEKQTKILEALTRKFKLHDNVDLPQIADQCSFTFTGADFYALCSDSMLNAMTRVANEVDAKIKEYNQALVDASKSEISIRWWFDNVSTEDDITVLVKMEDFLKAQLELNPSVSAEELEHYLRVRENFEGGKEKAKQTVEGAEIDPEIRELLQNGLSIDMNALDNNVSTLDSIANGSTNGQI